MRMANVLLRKLAVQVQTLLFWTDSTVVLQYVRNDSRRFHTFVANRVAEIREVSRPDQWKHVPSHLNPADLCSRGASVSTLQSDPRWKNGPEFLRKAEQHWPEQPPPAVSLSDDPEVRVHQVALTLNANEETSALPDPRKFSSWTKFKRVVAWMMRFIRNCIAKKGSGRADGKRQEPLSAEELKRAETKIVVDCQARSFAT